MLNLPSTRSAHTNVPLTEPPPFIKQPGHIYVQSVDITRFLYMDDIKQYAEVNETLIN